MSTLAAMALCAAAGDLVFERYLYVGAKTEERAVEARQLDLNVPMKTLAEGDMTAVASAYHEAMRDLEAKPFSEIATAFDECADRFSYLND